MGQEDPNNQLLLPIPLDGTCYNLATTSMTGYPAAADPKTAKVFGAFYTDSEIAEFLSAWAIRNPSDTVIDPSFGGAVFLRAASNRILRLGGEPSTQVYGVEVDKNVHSRIVSMLHDEFRIRASNLVLSDFFKVSANELPKFHAVIGNPPFIRYHRFKGTARKVALKRAKDLGVDLSELSSSWAPFLVCSASLIADGGRLAMVIPTELTYANYAKPVIAYMRDNFRKLTIVTFRKKLFPDLSEDTLLLLADDKGFRCESTSHYDLPNAGALRNGLESLQDVSAGSATFRLGLQFVDAKTRALYQELQANKTLMLGHHCSVGIGYVTGANNFFHLSRADVDHWNLSPKFLRPAVLNSRAFSGIEFSPDDLSSALETRSAAYLLHVTKSQSATPELDAYIRHGKKIGVSDAYKCRTRTPWYSVPNVYEPDAFLTYMSGMTPRLLANGASAVAPNNLHVLRFKNRKSGSRSAAISWLSSLSQLSAEVEGHALGGGMLKIEPREGARLLVPMPSLSSHAMKEAGATLDRLVRSGDTEEAQRLADKIVLRDFLGLSQASCSRLKAASLELKARRAQLHA